MSTKKLVWFSVGWIILTLFNYYYVPFFILAFEWLLMLVLLFVLIINHIVQLIIERKSFKKQRLFSLIIIIVISLLTFYRHIPNTIIEKIDCALLHNTRVEIVQKVKNDVLKPNVEHNGWICELPYEFPVVSNGGNDIGIFKSDDSFTVQFWIFRNFFDSPSISLIYSNDKKIIERIEKKINYKPAHNWKIRDNWYRIYGGY